MIFKDIYWKIRESQISFNQWIEKGVVDSTYFNEAICVLNKIDKKQLFTVLKQDTSVVEFLNLNEDLAIEILNKYPSLYKDIKIKSQRIDEAFIERFPGLLGEVSTQSISMCINALSQVSWTYSMVRIVPNPDPESTMKNLLKKRLLIEAISGE